MKGDQERALQWAIEQLAELRRGETVPMAPAQGDSAGNSEVESWIRRAKDQVRALKLDLVANIGEEVDSAHPVWPWLVEWGAQPLNRIRI